MKHTRSKVLVVFLLCGIEVLRARNVVDKVVARVGNSLIVMSDLSLARIGAFSYNLDQIIKNEVFLQEAVRKKQAPTELEVEKQVLAYKERNKLARMSDEEFEKHLKGHRFPSIAAFKKELARYMAVQSLLQQEIKDRIFVTSQEVENYHKSHPQSVEASYRLKTAIVPFSVAKTSEELKKLKDIDWAESDDWIRDSQLSDMISFVRKMKLGDIGKPIETEHGFQLVQLVGKKDAYIRELKECYVDIEELLRQKKMSEFEDELYNDLKQRVNIVIFKD